MCKSGSVADNDTRAPSFRFFRLPSVAPVPFGSRCSRRAQCAGLKISRWLLLRTILRRRSQCLDTIPKLRDALRQRLLPLYFKERINLEEQKAQLDNRFLRARQIALMIPRNFSVKVTHAAILDYSVLFSMSSLGHDVQGIDTRWDFFLLSIQKVPSNDILESLYKIRMRGSQIRTIC